MQQPCSSHQNEQLAQQRSAPSSSSHLVGVMIATTNSSSNNNNNNCYMQHRGGSDDDEDAECLGVAQRNSAAVEEEVYTAESVGGATLSLLQIDDEYDQRYGHGMLGGYGGVGVGGNSAVPFAHYQHHHATSVHSGAASSAGGGFPDDAVAEEWADEEADRAQEDDEEDERRRVALRRMQNQQQQRHEELYELQKIYSKAVRKNFRSLRGMPEPTFDAPTCLYEEDLDEGAMQQQQQGPLVERPPLGERPPSSPTRRGQWRSDNNDTVSPTVSVHADCHDEDGLRDSVHRASHPLPAPPAAPGLPTRDGGMPIVLGGRNRNNYSNGFVSRFPRRRNDVYRSTEEEYDLQEE